MVAISGSDALAQSATCTAGEETLVNYDYSAATWTAGTTSNTAEVYTGVGGTVSLTTEITGAGILAGWPRVETSGGATNRALVIDTNRGSAAATNTYTLSFSRAITKLRFVVSDIDYATSGSLNYRDRITVIGLNAIAGAATVAGVPTVGANVAMSLTNTRATANSVTACAATSASCNVTWNFSTPVSVVNIVYDNGTLPAGGNPTPQSIGLFDIDFCVPTVARVRPAKTTTGGVGTFNFTQTNLVSNPTVTTATVGTQALGAYVSASAVNTDASLTETLPFGGWTHTTTTASCIDENRAVSGNAAGNLATLAGTTYTIPGAAMDPGARITCSYTNSVTPVTIAIAKITNGGIGAFSFTGTGGLIFPNISTVTAGVAVTGPVQTYATPGVPVVLTETAPSGGFTVTAINCTGLGSGGTQTVNLVNRTVDLNAAAVFGGSNIICTFTNSQPSDLAVTKTNGVSTLASGAETIYTVRVTNAGPATASTAVFSDPAVTGLSKTAVACSAAVGNKCVTAPSVAQLEAGTFALPAIAAGEFYEITVTATVTATGY